MYFYVVCIYNNFDVLMTIDMCTVDVNRYKLVPAERSVIDDCFAPICKSFDCAKNYHL